LGGGAGNLSKLLDNFRRDMQRWLGE